ncbi:MFS general substrate transporter [Aspergillus unguis]
MNIIRHLSEDHSQYAGSSCKLVLDVAALVIVQFLQGLDSTIVSTAIPKITDRFHAIEDIGWYSSVFTLTFCALQLVWGKLYAFYVAKWVYLAGLFIFELGSLICGIAPSSLALILGRAIAGLGGGGTGAGALLLVSHLAPPRRRPTLIGILVSTFGFGAAVGPLVGGAFTNNPTLTWRWCFYINLPLGALSAAIVLAFVPVNKPPAMTTTWADRLLQMDLPGAMLLVPAVISLLIALQWGGSKYPWGNGRIIALFILAGLLGIGFVLSQTCRKDERYVMVPQRLFRDPLVWGSAILGASTTASFFVVLYYLPIWFQAVKGATPATSGVMNFPMTISFLLASVLGGALSSEGSPSSVAARPRGCPGNVIATMVGRWKPPSRTTALALSACIGPMLLSIGVGLLTTLSGSTGAGKWIGYQILVGAGSGLGMQTSLSAVQSLASQMDVHAGTTIIFLSQNLTASVLLSVAAMLFNSQLHSRLQDEVPELGADPTVVTDAGATGFRDVVPRPLIPDILEVFNEALTTTLFVAVGAACFGIVGIVWFPLKKWNRKRRKDGSGV